jgi:hypothetical protein
MRDFPAKRATQVRGIGYTGAQAPNKAGLNLLRASYATRVGYFSRGGRLQRRLDDRVQWGAQLNSVRRGLRIGLLTDHGITRYAP